MTEEVAAGVELEALATKYEESDLGAASDSKFRLSFSDVTITATLPSGEKKLIMDGVNGFAHSGQVMALMGPTGSGKTTLLNALANRLDPGVVLDPKSRVSYGGKPWHRALKRRVGMVEQDDVTFPELTVKQALSFAARLRLPGTNAEREERVNELIGQMRLDKVVDTPIGGGLVRGVSGGERKRVCIAAELISKPTLLFCDEPTSGLDSETALVIIGVLRDLSLGHRMCIICSIHQPSSQVYSQFDDLCFLDGGRCVYFGKSGKAAIDYFSSIVKSTCPTNYNPPDWFMEQAVNGSFSGVKMDVPVGNDFHEGNFDDADPGFAVSFASQVQVIFERSWLKVKVEKLQLPFYTQQLTIGVLAGILFVGLGKEEKDIFPRVSFAFTVLMGSIYLPMVEVLFVFVQDTLTLRKDLLTNSYHLLAYFVAKTIAGLPLLVILALCISTVPYTMAFYRFGSVQQYCALIAAFLLIANVFSSLGVCVAAWVKNPSYLFTVAIIVMVSLFNFAGFFVPRDTMFPAIAWLVVIDPATYAFALVFQIVILISGPSFKCAEFSEYDVCTDSKKITPEDVLEKYNMDTSIGTCFAVLFGMYVVCFALGYYFLRQKVMLWIK